jgi:predicted PilT family ATPase
VEKLNSILSKVGVYNISFNAAEKEMVIVGESKPVDKAAILTTFVIDHQVELIGLEQENSKILKSIETKRQKIKGDSVEEVLVPKELLGLIIGKSGANLTYVKKEYGVGIHILENDMEDAKEFTNTDIPEDKALIRIYGKDPEWVKAAKSFMCLQRITYPIEADKIDYVKGYQNTIVNDIKEKSGCIKLFVHDPEKGAFEGFVEAIGNEEALERLQLLMDTHMEFYGTHQDKQNKNRELTKQASKYNSYGEAFYDKNQSVRGDRRRAKKY